MSFSARDPGCLKLPKLQSQENGFLRSLKINLRNCHCPNWDPSGDFSINFPRHRVFTQDP